MKSSTNVIVLGKEKAENNPQLQHSNLIYFELLSMQVEAIYKTEKKLKLKLSSKKQNQYKKLSLLTDMFMATLKFVYMK